MRQDVRDDWDWADTHLDFAIDLMLSHGRDLGMIRKGTRREDCERVGDIVIIGQNTAFRVIRPDKNYRDLTIRARRATGTKTEIDKFREGLGKWFLFGWSNGNGGFEDWMIVDLNKFRSSGLAYDNRIENDTNDGGHTWFYKYSIEELEKNNCIILGSKLINQLRSPMLNLAYAFDLEVFSNFFSAIFIDVENTFDENVFLIYKGQNDAERLKEFIDRRITLVGYNNLYFDNVLLNAIRVGYENLFELAQDIISIPSYKKKEELTKSQQGKLSRINNLRGKVVPYKSIDFKELVGLDISLKQALTVLEWSTIRELPFPPEKIIEDKDVPQILSYNRNDVLPLIKLYDGLSSELELRQKVSELYGVDVSSKSEGQLPNIIFEKLYSQAVNKSIKTIKEGRTTRPHIRLADCIGKGIYFNSATMNDFLGRISEIDLTQGFREYLDFAGLTFNLGVGGIHTQDNPGCFYSDSDHLILDCDVTSFYPNIVLFNDIKPAHVDSKFLDIFRGLIKERVEAKARGDKVTADVLKISINAVFGKMGNPDYWLYDPLAFYSVTISGQLYLLLLVEFLTLKGIEVISANTDGVTCRVKKSQEEAYYKACKQWEEQTGFSLEFNQYLRYIRRDVNAYVAQKADGKLKRKGIFETKEDISLYRRLQKSYTPDIIPQALTNYFIYDKSVEETIKNSTNIFDFLMSQRVGKSFNMVFKSGLTEQQVQRVNRYYVSTEGGILSKRGESLVKKNGQVDDLFDGGNRKEMREISVLSGVQIQILNHIDRSKCFNEYKVDLDYYCSEVMKIIEGIEVTQLQLF